MTFEEMKDRLARWLSVSTTKRFTEAERGEAINMAMRDLIRDYDLRFGEKSTVINAVLNDYDYPISSDFIRPMSVWYLGLDGGKVELDYKVKSVFDELYPNRVDTGEPDIYAVYGQDILIGPTPDGSYALNWDYYGLLADLQDGSPNNTNVFVENNWEVIFYKALVRSSMFLGHDMRVGMWKAEAETREMKLTQEHSRARSSGRKAISEIPG